MAQIELLKETAIRISVDLSDAIRMVQEAARDIPKYARDIVIIAEKMPAFDYTNFCFYAYDSAQLFEFILHTDPREYLSFALDAPDAFFYAVYGGMNALSAAARQVLEAVPSGPNASIRATQA